MLRCLIIRSRRSCAYGEQIEEIAVGRLLFVFGAVVLWLALR